MPKARSDSIEAHRIQATHPWRRDVLRYWRQHARLVSTGNHSRGARVLTAQKMPLSARCEAESKPVASLRAGYHVRPGPRGTQRPSADVETREASCSTAIFPGHCCSACCFHRSTGAQRQRHRIRSQASRCGRSDRPSPLDAFPTLPSIRSAAASTGSQPHRAGYGRPRTTASPGPHPSTPRPHTPSAL